MKEHILIVDDDPQIVTFLERYLGKQNFRVSTASSGEDAGEVLSGDDVDLCILDIGLPGRDGLEVTRDIRARSRIPIIMLSGRDDTIDRVIGLEVGADDYVTKPFEPRELLARIRCVLRRCQDGEPQMERGSSAPVAEFGTWRIDFASREVRDIDTGTDAGLTTTEFDLLRAFVDHPQTVLSRDRLLDLARGRAAYSLDRSVDVHIMRLRKKIEPEPAAPIYIKTVHGAGYLFAAMVSWPGPTPARRHAG